MGKPICSDAVKNSTNMTKTQAISPSNWPNCHTTACLVLLVEATNEDTVRATLARPFSSNISWAEQIRPCKNKNSHKTNDLSTKIDKKKKKLKKSLFLNKKKLKNTFLCIF